MYKLLCSNITKSHRSLTNFTGYYRKVAQKCNRNSPASKKLTSEADAHTIEETPEPIECSEEAVEADTSTDKKGYTPFFTQKLGAPPLGRPTTARFFHTSHANNKCSDVAFKRPFKSKEAERYYKQAIEQCLQIRSKLDKFQQQSNWAARPPNLTTQVDKELERANRRKKTEKPTQKPLKKLEAEKRIMLPELEKIAQMKTAKPTSQFKGTKLRITYPTHVARYKVGTTGYKLQHQVKQKVVENDEVKTVYKDPVPEPLQSKVKHQNVTEKEKATLQYMRNKARQKSMQQKCVEDNSEQAKQQKKYEQATIQQHPTVRRANTTVKMAFKNRYNKLLQKSGLLYQAPTKSKEEEEGPAAKEADHDVALEEHSPRPKVAQPHRDTGEEIFKVAGSHQETLKEATVTEHPIAITKQASADTTGTQKHPQRILSEKSESFDVDATCIKENTRSNATTTLGDYIAESEEKVKNFVESYKQEGRALLNKYKNSLTSMHTPEANEETKSGAGREGTVEAIGEYLKKLKELRDQTAVDLVNIKKMEGPKQQKVEDNKRQEQQVGGTVKKDEPVKTVEGKVGTKQQPHVPLDREGAKKKQYPISDKFVVKKDVDSFIRKAVNVVKDKVIQRARPKKPNLRSQSMGNSMQEKTSPTRPVPLKTAKSENLFKKVQIKPAQLKTAPQAGSSKNAHSKTPLKKIKARFTTRNADQPQENSHRFKKTPKEVGPPLKKILNQYRVPIKGEVTVSMAEMKRINRRKRREREKRLKEETKQLQKKFEEEAKKAMLKESDVVRNREKERKRTLVAAEVKNDNETTEGGEKNELERVTAAILQGIEKIALLELKKDAEKAKNGQEVAGELHDETEEHDSMLHPERVQKDTLKEDTSTSYQTRQVDVQESTAQTLDNQTAKDDQTGSFAESNPSKPKTISEKIIEDTEVRLRQVVEDNRLERTKRTPCTPTTRQVNLEDKSAKSQQKSKIGKAKSKNQAMGKRKFLLSQDTSETKSSSATLKEKEKDVSRDVDRGRTKKSKDKERNKGKYILENNLNKLTDPVVAKSTPMENLERMVGKAADDSKDISQQTHGASSKETDMQMSKDEAEQINEKEIGERKVYKLEDGLKNHSQGVKDECMLDIDTEKGYNLENSLKSHNNRQGVEEESILDTDTENLAKKNLETSEKSVVENYLDSNICPSKVEELQELKEEVPGKLSDGTKLNEADVVSVENATPKEKEIEVGREFADKNLIKEKGVQQKQNLKGKYMLRKFDGNIIKTEMAKGGNVEKSEELQNTQRDLKMVSKPPGKYLLENNIVPQERKAEENSGQTYFRINFDNVMKEIKKYIPDTGIKKFPSNIDEENTKAVAQKTKDQQRNLLAEKNASHSNEISNRVTTPTKEYQSKNDLDKGSDKTLKEMEGQKMDAALEKRPPETASSNMCAKENQKPENITHSKIPELKSDPHLGKTKVSKAKPANDSKNDRYVSDKLSKFQRDNIAKLREASTKIVKLVKKLDFDKTTRKAEEKSTVPENRPTIRKDPPPKSKDKPIKDKPKSKREIILPPKGRIDPKIQYTSANTHSEEPKSDIVQEITELISKAGLVRKGASERSKSLPNLVREQKTKIPKGVVKTTWKRQANKTKKVFGVKRGKETQQSLNPTKTEEVPRLIVKLKYKVKYGTPSAANKVMKSKSWQTISQVKELERLGGKPVNPSREAHGKDDDITFQTTTNLSKRSKRDSPSSLHFRKSKRARIEDDSFRRDPKSEIIRLSPKDVLWQSQNRSKLKYNAEAKTKRISERTSKGDVQMDSTSTRWRSTSDRAFYFQKLRRGKIEDDTKTSQTSRSVQLEKNEDKNFRQDPTKKISSLSIISDTGGREKENVRELKTKFENLDAETKIERQSFSETKLEKKINESKSVLVVNKEASSGQLIEKTSDTKIVEKENPKMKKDIERLIEVMKKADKELEEVLRVYEIFKKPLPKPEDVPSTKQPTNVEEKEKSPKLGRSTALVTVTKAKPYEIAKDSKSYIVTDGKAQKNADTKKAGTSPQVKPSTKVGDKKNSKKECKVGEKPAQRPHKYLLTAGVQKEAKKLLKGKKEEPQGDTTKTTKARYTKKPPMKAKVCHKDHKGTDHTTKTATKEGEKLKTSGKKNLLCSDKKKSAKLDCEEPKVKKDACKKPGKNGSANDTKTVDGNNKLSVQMSDGKEASGNKIVVACGNYAPRGSTKDRVKCEERKQKPVEIPGKRKTKVKVATHVSMPTDTPHEPLTQKRIAKKQTFQDAMLKKHKSTPKKRPNKANKATSTALQLYETYEEDSDLSLSEFNDSSKNSAQSIAQPKTTAAFTIMRSDLVDRFVKSKDRASKKPEKSLRTVFVNKKIVKCVEFDTNIRPKRKSKLAPSPDKKRNVEDRKPKSGKAEEAHLSWRRQKQSEKKKGKDQRKPGQSREKSGHKNLLEQAKNPPATETKACGTESITILSNNDLKLIKLAQTAREGILQTNHMLDKQLEMLEALPRLYISPSRSNSKKNLPDNNCDTNKVKDATKIDKFRSCDTEIPTERQRTTPTDENVTKVLVEDLDDQEKFKEALVGIKENVEVKNIGYKVSKRNMNSDSGDCRKESVDQNLILHKEYEYEATSPDKLEGEKQEGQFEETTAKKLDEKKFTFSNNYLDNAYKKVKHILSIVNDDKRMGMNEGNQELKITREDNQNTRMASQKLETEIERHSLSWNGTCVGTKSEPILKMKLEDNEAMTEQAQKVDGKELEQVDWKTIAQFHERNRVCGRQEKQNIQTDVASNGHNKIPAHTAIYGTSAKEPKTQSPTREVCKLRTKSEWTMKPSDIAKEKNKYKYTSQWIRQHLMGKKDNTNATIDNNKRCWETRSEGASKTSVYFNKKQRTSSEKAEDRYKVQRKNEFNNTSQSSSKRNEHAAMKREKETMKRALEDTSKTLLYSKKKQKTDVQLSKYENVKDNPHKRMSTTKTIEEPQREKEEDKGEVKRNGEIKGPQISEVQSSYVTPRISDTDVRVSCEKIVAEEKLKRVFALYLSRKDYFRTIYSRNGDQDSSKRHQIVSTQNKCKVFRKKSILARIKRNVLPTVLEIPPQRSQDDLSPNEDADDGTNKNFDESVTKSPENVCGTVTESLKFSEDLFQKLTPDKKCYKQQHKAIQGPVKARIEEILKKRYKEDEKVYKFNKNLIRHFQRSNDKAPLAFPKQHLSISTRALLDPKTLEVNEMQKMLYQFLAMTKPFYDHSPTFSLLKNSNQWQGVLYCSNGKEDKDLKPPSNKNVTIYIERSPKNRYTTEKEETPAKPVNRSCERLCLPLKAISQVALKPSTEELTTLNKSQKGEILAVPKTIPNVMDKYKGLKITYINVRRAGRRREEGFLPTMKHKSEAMVMEKAYDPETMRRQILEFRYELLRKLHKEFSDMYEKDVNGNVGKFEKVSKYYEKVARNVKSEEKEEIAVKPQLKSMEELLGPCPKPSFERVSRYYDIVMEKNKEEGREAERAKNTVEALVEKLSDETSEVDRSRNDCEGMGEVLAKSRKEDRSEGKDPEDAGKRS